MGYFLLLLNRRIAAADTIAINITRTAGISKFDSGPDVVVVNIVEVEAVVVEGVLVVV